LKRKSIPKIAVLATGLAVAMMAATISPPVAQAFPSKQQECLNCHGPGTVGSTVTAVPSTTTPAAGATYTVAVGMPANADEPAGDTGYWIANSTAAGVTGTSTLVYGGNDGTGAATRTATMTAPAAAGTYYYKVWAVKGSTATTGVTNSALYSITVAGAPVVVTTTTALAVTPVTPVVAPASPTLKATVSGAGAAGTVEFFNGTTSLGAATAISAGVASKTLSGVAAGNYSYTAVFTPTDVAAFTSSTSSAVAYVVTVPVPTAVTTTTALGVTPTSPVVAPASPTLTATVSGAGAAGTVEFFNGTTSLGAATAISAGVASKTLSGVAAGTYAYKAVFTPTDAAAFTSSTSAVVAPASATLTATVSGAGAAGSVAFLDNGVAIGLPVAVDLNGVATKGLVELLVGSYSYTAVFTPTDATAFSPSTSSATAFEVTAAPVTTPISSFTASAITGDAPLAVTLTDTSTRTPTSWLWDFGGGTPAAGSTTADQNPSVDFAAAGTYTMTLTASNADGVGTVATQDITVTVPVPVSAFISGLSPKRGLVGDIVTINGSNFGAAGQVQFGNYVVDATSWTDTQITFVVPAAAAGDIYGRAAGVFVTPTGDTQSNIVVYRFAHVK